MILFLTAEVTAVSASAVKKAYARGQKILSDVVSAGSYSCNKNWLSGNSC